MPVPVPVPLRAALVLCLLAWLAPSVAWSQRVVVLGIDGDGPARLRLQIEEALKAAGVVKVVGLGSYKDAAAKRRLIGGAAMTAVGVARAAKVIQLDAAVGGEVNASTYRVVIWDRAGQELWTRELAVKGGLLSEEVLVKLSRAIAAAGEQGAAKPVESSSGTEPESVDPAVKGTAEEEGTRDADLDREARGGASAGRPPVIRLAAGGTTTWRYQCLRPGVDTCREYDTAQPTPDGIRIDFTASVPYLGLYATLDLFPLTRLGDSSSVGSRAIQGIGLLAGINAGFSRTRIVEETTQGSGQGKLVASTDVGWFIQAAWRLFFSMGYGYPRPVGFVGVRGGVQGRSFTIDPKASVSVPSSQRVGFPQVGIDFSVPFIKYLRVEGSGSLYLVPKPSAEQIVGYGNLRDPSGGVQSSGWGAEAGLAGDIVGSLGWQARLKVMSFADRFRGEGQKWTTCNTQQCGGASEEFFTSVHWGAVFSY